MSSSFNQNPLFTYRDGKFTPRLVRLWDGTKWVRIINPYVYSDVILVEGGTTEIIGDYTYHTLTNGQTLTITGNPIELDYIIIDNGSDGNNGNTIGTNGGRGGNGGRTLTGNDVFSPDSYDVVIGSPSSFGSIDSVGGTVSSGGSGATGAGSPAQNGQNGTLWVDSLRYAGAGGGGGHLDADLDGGSGGLRGGGNGANANAGEDGQNGTNTLGGGGGGGVGASNVNFRGMGGSGGTGIVKVRYLTSLVSNN